MSNKPNYGPRFRSSAVSVGYKYDETIDAINHRDNMRLLAILDSQPRYKQELRQYKAVDRVKKKAAAARDKNHRYEAEQRMEEAIRKAVEMLEFHMNDLMEHRYTSARPQLVNQYGIHNAIVHLRKNCGVIFENGLQYDQPIHVTGGCETQEQRSERIRAQIAEQKIERQRYLRELAKKYLKHKEAVDGNRNGQ